MKEKFLFLLFFGLLSIQASPQLPQFSKIYTERYSNLLYGEQFDSSGYLFCGIREQINADSLAVIKTNKKGTIEWYYTLKTASSFSKPKFAAVINSNLIVAATQKAYSGELTITGLNSGGEKLWTKSYFINSNFFVLKVISRGDDFIVGLQTDNINLAVLCFDTEGNLKWQKNNTIGTFSNKADIVILPDSSFVVASSVGLVKLNKFGELVFTKNTIVTKLHLAETEMLIGVRNNSLFKMDFECNFIWGKPFTSQSLSDVVYSPLGYYLTSTSGSTILKIDLDGNKIGEEDSRRISNSLFICTDNTLLMAGQNFACKADENGKSTVIDISQPAAGELVNNLSEYYIRWYSSNVEFVNIEYSTNSGTDWNTIINYFPSSAYFIWSIPDISSDSCLIRIKDSYNYSIFAVNENTFRIQSFNSYDYIAANEILMWIGNNGDGSHDPNTDGSGFYWPGGINNTGQTAIFEDGLCWGGKVDGEIRVNGNTHRQGLKPGNILPDGTAANPIDPKFRVYKIKKNWEYLPPSPERDKYEYNFLNWPADLGAPWIDNNNDGIYSPGIDQPDYVGDEVLFYVANDLDTNTTRFTYGSNPIGFEFQTTVYAFERENLKNVVFKKYQIINKSEADITELYFTYWADCDLGDANDDWSAIDTNLSISYIYNGDNDDGMYGVQPPAVAHLLLQSPIVSAGINDSAFYKSRWIKGFKNIKINAGGMILKHGLMQPYPGNPRQGIYEGSIEFYNIMKGLANNGEPIIDPNTGDTTTFCVPGDPVAGTGWYHGQGFPGGNPPGDSYYQLACGPFNMAPGDTQEVVYAIFMSQGSSNIQSIAELRKDASYYLNSYYNNFPVSVEDKNSLLPDEFVLYQNYPNPFNPTTKIQFTLPSPSKGEGSGVRFSTLKIYDILGREITTLINKELAPGNYEVEFNASTLASGVYFYRIESGSFSQTKKMVLIR